MRTQTTTPFAQPIVAESAATFLYEHCDIPSGMTLTDWRRDLDGNAPRRRRLSLLRRRSRR
jgi:hypothetical protein